MFKRGNAFFYRNAMVTEISVVAVIYALLGFNKIHRSRLALCWLALKQKKN